jgi:hypothetical protein
MIKRNTYYELEHTDIIGMKYSSVPYAYFYKRNQSGYGKNIPLSYMLKLQDKKWHRVYLVIYSNSGTVYVKYQGNDYVPCEIAINAYRIMKGSMS